MKDEKKVLIEMEGQGSNHLEIDLTFLRSIRRDNALLRLIHDSLKTTERDCWRKIPKYPTIQIKIDGKEYKINASQKGTCFCVLELVEKYLTSLANKARKILLALFLVLAFFFHGKFSFILLSICFILIFIFVWRLFLRQKQKIILQQRDYTWTKAAIRRLLCETEILIDKTSYNSKIGFS